MCLDISLILGFPIVSVSAFKIIIVQSKTFEKALFLIFSLFIQLALNVRVTFYPLVPSRLIMKKMTGMSPSVMGTESSECHLLINRGNLKTCGEDIIVTGALTGYCHQSKGRFTAQVISALKYVLHGTSATAIGSMIMGVAVTCRTKWVQDLLNVTGSVNIHCDS